MTHILLLNASYEPLTVLPLQRAVGLWLRNRVTAATPERIRIGTAGQPFELPAVVRLTHYIHVPQRRATWSRKAVLHRDRFRCIYCAAQPGDRQNGRLLTTRDFTIDHIIPKSRGGRNLWGNTACACAHCNRRKGNRTPHEAGMKLLWEPKIPRVNYLVFSGNIPEAWRIYLQTTR